MKLAFTRDVKIAFITACVYPNTDPIRMLAASAKRCGIDLFPYGKGGRFNGWGDVKVTKLLPLLASLEDEGFTHVLYTDGRDSLFVRDRGHIIHSYHALGSPPCVLSAEKNCYPDWDLASDFPDRGTPWRYPCAGQYMGEIPYIREYWAKIQKAYTHLDDNDQAWIARGMVDGLLDEVILDSYCDIFQSVVDGNEIDWSKENNAWVNLTTDSQPSVLHFNGGYCDPLTGRDERMLPFWEKMNAA